MADPHFLTCYTDDVERLGLETGGQLHALGGQHPSLEWLLATASLDDVQRLAREARGPVVTGAQRTPRLRLGQQEVWAAGVTYKRSEEARERESNQSNIYTRVYHADRPELFMKGIGYQAVSEGDPVGIRYDASWSVPEPELVVVLNARMEVVGFTIGNDMSSRDIEGGNPLYLPQAKVYEGSCAVGPRIWLQPGATEWPDVEIAIAIRRGAQTVFADTTSTGRLHRTLADLVEYLGRCKRFPYGALLFTGTGVVPPDPFTLEAGDVVAITIDPIGTLTNPVVTVGPANNPQ